MTGRMENVREARMLTWPIARDFGTQAGDGLGWLISWSESPGFVGGHARGILALVAHYEALLVGFEEFKEARTEHEGGDSIWMFYDAKLWRTITYWKEKYETLLAEVGRWERDRARLEAAIRSAQFFITASLPIIKDGDISGEGMEIAGEVLAEMEALVGKYETGMLSRAALGEGQDSDRPAVGECPCDGDRGCVCQ